MVAPAFIDSDTVDLAGGLSITFTIPAAATNGDFMIAFVKQSENTTQRIWDDDGGGGNGWTREVYNRTTGGRDQETAIYWKFHTGSESNPTFTWASGVTSEPMSGSLLVYRGVDPNVPFQGPTFLESQNDPSPPNPSVEIIAADTRVICFHAATHDDISSPQPPTGFTARTQVWNGTSDDHRNHFTADIEIDTIGTYNPPDWQHATSNNTPEYHTYTMALNAPVPIGITAVAPDSFVYGANITVDGFGFEAIQNTGTIELLSDPAGTISQTLSVVSWADDQIVATTSQGSLSNDTILYVRVTNDTGDVSGVFLVSVGLLPYASLLQAFSPDHYWQFNNSYLDTGITGPQRDFTGGIVGTWTFTAANIRDGNSHALNMNAVSNRRELSPADSPNMNVTINAQERTLMMWIQTNVVERRLAAWFKEGGGVQNLAFLMGYGNVILAQMADSPANPGNIQAWSDIKLTPGRPYHICMRYDFPNNFELFLDGRLQLATAGNPLGAGNFDSHSGDVVIGDPDANLETGGTDISYDGPSDGQMSDFATWSDNSAYPNNSGGAITDADILTLFQRGAVPDDIIAAGTPTAMQTALDVFASTTRQDWPLSFRIEAPNSGGPNLTLEMDAITFNDRITEHIEWRGTGVLTILSRNGTNLDLAKTFTPGGGSIVIVADRTLTVTDVPNGGEVRVYIGGTQTEIGGQETINTGLFTLSISPSIATVVDIQVVSLPFTINRFENIDLSSGDVVIPLANVVDRVFSNP